MFGFHPGSTAYEPPAKTFAGVRFALFGFDPIDAQQVQEKLVSEGGVDVGQDVPNCTHVIVHKLIYDDPICVAARSNGKILVTALWVDDSYDIGMPVDATNVMYRPVRDLGGIPGAKSFLVCLTGYHGQERTDIMTLVSLMGASFSKPLVAHKVTHLICYKFEGDKYELARKLGKIKLVNHHWLQDCLKAWEILPEENYDRSGYELETMEVEAKDSEEEGEEYEHRKMAATPSNLRNKTVTAKMSPHLNKEMLVTNASKGLSTAGNSHGKLLAATENTLPPQDPHEKQAQVKSSAKEFPTSPNVLSGLASASGSARRSPSASKSSAASSGKTPKKSTTPPASSKLHQKIDKLNISDDFYMSSPVADHVGNGAGSGCYGTPSKASNVTLEEHRSVTLPKTDVSSCSSKSQKLNHGQKTRISGSPLATHKNVLPETDGLSSLNVALDAASNPGTKHYFPAKTAFSSYSRPGRKSLMNPIIREDTPGKKEDKEGAPSKTSHTNLSSAPGSNSLNRENVAASESVKQSKDPQEVQVPDLEANVSVTEKDPPSKPSTRKKTVAKKSSGSGKKGSSNSKSQKGTLDLNKTTVQSDAETDARHEREEAVKERSGFSGKVELRFPAADIDQVMVTETDKVGSLDDETEPPEDDEETIFEEARGAASKRKKDDLVFKKAEDMRPVEPHTTSSSTHIVKERSSDDKKNTSGVEENGAELGQAVQGKKDEPEKPETKDGGKRKLTKLKRHPLAKASAKSSSSVPETKNPIEGTSGMESKTEKKSGKIKKKQNKISSSSDKTKRTEVLDEMEVDKENRPSGMEEPKTKKKSGKKEKKITSSLDKTKRTEPCDEMEVDKENRPSPDAGHENVQVRGVEDKADSNNVRTPNEPELAEAVFIKRFEPSLFILSGHRIQRKEFQQVIKRLKGRVCKDSHKWSYQATHFIVPDPVRRTEKFFAAAASGRWILKTDYLTACNEAGKFVGEEPYEWHSSSLTEDGAINLEAPRKWRLLRERTGHGAFYGMRIIIYGECISPSLDTLKRVIKAGDGTILATSPPYTRFLNTEVDFAIVSPGTLHVDVWVQEFIRHKIPCVSADYLVEYVCKPGYPLDKHVQFNTHDLAKRSLANLVRRSKEVVAAEEIGDDGGDVTCQVCGCGDRGDVMLICGDESGSSGCGAGTHIDCCIPPLECVPDEDWFCSKCEDEAALAAAAVAAAKKSGYKRPRNAKVDASDGKSSRKSRK